MTLAQYQSELTRLNAIIANPLNKGYLHDAAFTKRYAEVTTAIQRLQVAGSVNRTVKSKAPQVSLLPAPVDAPPPSYSGAYEQGGVALAVSDKKKLATYAKWGLMVLGVVLFFALVFKK